MRLPATACKPTGSYGMVANLNLPDRKRPQSSRSASLKNGRFPPQPRYRIAAHPLGAACKQTGGWWDEDRPIR